MKIVVVGGGFAGCAAALAAARMGACVTLLERTDMLCGTGVVGGIMRNNGRYTAAEEMIAMGGGQLFTLIDRNCRHKNIEFPGHAHASLFDVAKVPAAVARYLIDSGVDIRWMSRVTSVEMRPSCRDGNDRVLERIKDSQGNIYEADAFIDATGTAGPAAMCSKHGNGCAMCVLRCPAFGGRISLCALCGIKEFAARRKVAASTDSDTSAPGTVQSAAAAITDSDTSASGTLQSASAAITDSDTPVLYGAMSGSCKLMKESLSLGIQEHLNLKGCAVIKVPDALVENHLDMKACQQYALPEYAGNLILLDTGHAKLMTPWFPLEKLHQVPGFENARYEDPYAGGKGNSIRLTAMVRREDTMKVCGLANVFCGGEKAGPFVGHTEAIVTGTLAGHNAVCLSAGRPLLTLPESTACGDAIAWVRKQMDTETGLDYKYTFSGSILFDRMKAKGLYTTDTRRIRDRIADCGMENVFAGVV